MSVSSMTGFARAAGSSGPWRWAFELKSVNAKGLDLRLRMPAPFDRAEIEARARLAKALARGTCFANLSAQREGATAAARIDLAALESIAVAARAAAVKAGLALNPTFSMSRALVSWGRAMSDDPTYLAQLEPLFESMRIAGVPES